MASTEQAVEDYLRALKEPDSLRDEAELAEIRQAIQDADTFTERLRQQAALRRAEHPDTDDYRSKFVEHAKAWADVNGVAREDFAELGVPDDVLAEAFDGAKPKRKGGARKSGRVKREAAKAAIQGMPANFTRKDASEESGASIATVASILKEMVDAGDLQVQDDPKHDGVGRAAKVYTRT